MEDRANAITDVSDDANIAESQSFVDSSPNGMTSESAEDEDAEEEVILFTGRHPTRYAYMTYLSKCRLSYRMIIYFNFICTILVLDKLPKNRQNVPHSITTIIQMMRIVIPTIQIVLTVQAIRVLEFPTTLVILQPPKFYCIKFFQIKIHL